jgi:hypothetical protein
MKTSSSEPQLRWPDKREDDRDNIAKAAGRPSGEREREVAVGDVHDRVHVPGACRWSMATLTPLWATMAVEQRKKQQQQHLLPAATDPEPPAGMPKGQGRRRKEGGIGTAMHAHAGWQGRLHTGRLHTAPLGPSQTSQLRVAAGWLPSVTSQGCTPELAYIFAGPRRRLVAAAMRAVRRAYATTGPMARRCRRNPAKGVQTRALQAMMTAKLCSCLALLYQPCLALGAAFLAFCLQGFGSTGAHHWPKRNGMPNFTWLAADAPWAVVGEALAVAAMIGRAWKELGEQLSSPLSGSSLPVPRTTVLARSARGCVKRVVAVGSPDVPQNL